MAEFDTKLETDIRMPKQLNVNGGRGEGAVRQLIRSAQVTRNSFEVPKRELATIV